MHRFIYIQLLLVLLNTPIYAQPKAFNNDVTTAFTLYTTYTNQITHTVNTYAKDFFKINQMLADSFLYDPSIFLKDDPFDFIPIFPQKSKHVYEQLIIYNGFLPYEKRGKSLLLAGKIKEVCAEIKRSRYTLIDLLQTKTYSDSLHNNAVRKLMRVEVLYYDLHTLHKKLLWELQGMHQLYIQKYSKKTKIMLDLYDQLYKSVDQHLTFLRSHGHKHSIYSANDNIRKKLLIISQILQTQLIEYNQSTADLIRSIQKKITLLSDLLPARLTLNDRTKEAVHWHNQVFLPQLNRTNKGIIELINNHMERHFPNMLRKLEFPIHYKAPLLRGTENDLAPIDVDSFFNSLDLTQKIDTIQNDTKTQQKYVASHLIYLIDVSSSMNTPEKLPIVKQALKYLTTKLSNDNLITIITYSKKANVLLPPTQSTESTLINKAIDQLYFGSKSNIHAGLKMAYQIADEYFIEKGDNQIFLATDGDIEIAKNEKQILQKQKRKNGIQFHTLYVSEKVYSHHKSNLSKLTDIGGGSFIHVDKTNFKEQIISPLRKKEK